MKAIIILFSLLHLASAYSGFLPYGSAAYDTNLPYGDDNGVFVPLPSKIPFFNFVVNQYIWIGTNGVISLNGPNPSVSKLGSSAGPVIAPYWADALTSGRLPGRVSYRVSGHNVRGSATLEAAEALVRSNFPTGGAFNASFAVVATWDRVTCFGCQSYHPMNSFQCVITTDGMSTFLFFFYNGLDWTKGTALNQNAMVGFDAADAGKHIPRHSFSLPSSGTPAIASHANSQGNCAVAAPGKWCFSAVTPPIRTTLTPPAPTTTTTSTTSTSTTTTSTTTTSTTTTAPSTTTTMAPYDGSLLECSAILAAFPLTTDGVQTITVNGVAHSAYCDMSGGGWTFIQRRTGGSQDFHQTMAAYEAGFGNANSDYWLGLDAIRYITAQSPHNMRVDLMDCDKFVGSIVYTNFGLATGKCYNLTFSGSTNITGDIGDGLNDGATNTQKGYGFMTKDNNKCANYYPGVDCGSYMKNGGWWFHNCPAMATNLNGQYYATCDEGGKENRGIQWNTWKQAKYSLLRASMKIRPA